MPPTSTIAKEPPVARAKAKAKAAMPNKPAEEWAGGWTGKQHHGLLAHKGDIPHFIQHLKFASSVD